MSRSVWSMAPALFLFDIGAAVFLSNVFALFAGGIDPALISMLTLPVFAYIAHWMGRKCASDSPGRKANRSRLWGAATLVGAFYGVFSYFLFQYVIDEIQRSPTLQAQLPPEAREAFQDPLLLKFAAIEGGIFAALLFFGLHAIFLILGARSVEKARSA